MTDFDLPPRERRTIQRDWLGHGLQFIGVVVVIGVPVFVWGMNTNATVAVVTNNVELLRHDVGSEHNEQQTFAAEMRTALGQITKDVSGLQGDIRVLLDRERTTNNRKK